MAPPDTLVEPRFMGRTELEREVLDLRARVRGQADIAAHIESSDVVKGRFITELDVLRFIADSAHGPAPTGDIESPRALAVHAARNGYAIARDYLLHENERPGVSASGGIVPRESRR